MSLAPLRQLPVSGRLTRLFPRRNHEVVVSLPFRAPARRLGQQCHSPHPISLFDPKPAQVVADQGVTRGQRVGALPLAARIRARAGVAIGQSQRIMRPSVVGVQDEALTCRLHGGGDVRRRPRAPRLRLAQTDAGLLRVQHRFLWGKRQSSPDRFQGLGVAPLGGAALCQQGEDVPVAGPQAVRRRQLTLGVFVSAGLVRGECQSQVRLRRGRQGARRPVQQHQPLRLPPDLHVQDAKPQAGLGRGRGEAHGLTREGHRPVNVANLLVQLGRCT